MKSTLLTLELKRSELLSKFEPTYPLVVEVEKQIRETQATIAGEKDAPVRDETTDQNPTYEWVKSEMAKARTELSGLKARAAANQTALVKYRNDARALAAGRDRPTRSAANGQDRRGQLSSLPPKAGRSQNQRRPGRARNPERRYRGASDHACITRAVFSHTTSCFAFFWRAVEASG